MCKKKEDKTTKITKEMKKLYIKIKKNSVTQSITKKETISNKKKLKEKYGLCVFLGVIRNKMVKTNSLINFSELLFITKLHFQQFHTVQF